ELVAAARSAYAAQNSFAHQRLQHWFEMTWRQPMARRERFCGDGAAAGGHGNIQDGGNSQHALARQQHCRSAILSRAVRPNAGGYYITTHARVEWFHCS